MSEMRAVNPSRLPMSRRMVNIALYQRQLFGVCSFGVQVFAALVTLELSPLLTLASSALFTKS